MESSPVRPHTVGACFQSDSILQILQEIENEARGPVTKTQPPPKNHLKENIQRLKKIEAEGKKKTEKKQPIRAKTNPQMEKCLPRLQPPRTALPTVGRTPLLRPCRSLPQLHEDTQGNERALDTPCSSRLAESARSDSGSEISVPGGTKTKTKTQVKHRPGQIPNYLLERRREWDAEKERERKREETSFVPEGYSLLPDTEREETLDLLKKNREELLCSLSRLPVRNDTLRLRGWREELERQLAKVEEGIRIFARPRVLIKHE